VATYKELGLRSGTDNTFAVNSGSGAFRRLTVATIVPVVRTYPNDRCTETVQTWNENWQSKTVPFCLPEAPDWLPWERNWSFTMRNRTLITWPRDTDGTLLIGV